MFGYVRPVMDKLPREEQERFQSAYCGLCHALGARYGLLARCTLTYDFTFLAVLLSAGEQKEVIFRCPAKRFSLKKRQRISRALELAADESMILTRWKLWDEVRDSRGLRRAGVQLLWLLTAPAYRKAAHRRPAFAANARQQMMRLYALEQSRVPSLDRPADAFALLLAAASDGMGDSLQQQIHRQLLFQLGRWIYLVDALDDRVQDARTGAYNPLIARYRLKDGVLDTDSRHRIIATIDHSANLIASAFALGDYGTWRGVLENIIYYGLPTAGRMVLEGSWHTKTVRTCSRQDTESHRTKG